MTNNLIFVANNNQFLYRYTFSHIIVTPVRHHAPPITIIVNTFKSNYWFL